MHTTSQSSYSKSYRVFFVFFLTAVLLVIAVVVAFIVTVAAVLRLEAFFQSRHSLNLHFGLYPAAYGSWIIQSELLTHVDICSSMIAKKKLNIVSHSCSSKCGKLNSLICSSSLNRMSVNSAMIAKKN